MRREWIRRLAMFLWGAVLPLGAQQDAWTLERAVRQAVEKYPSIRASLEQVSAAAAGIRLARTAYLPRVDAYGQVNRATRNNVYGMLLPQAMLPSISGPPHPENDMANVWGSAAGFLVSWEPFDFGLRKAGDDAADRARRRAESAVERTRLEIATSTADAFLTVLAADRMVEAARAGVKRARVLEETVAALVRAQLRPGADAARTRAEAALAETQLIQAEQAAAEARVALAKVLDVPAAQVSLETGRLAQLPPEKVDVATPGSDHPVLKEQTAAIEEVKARQRILDRSWYPRFNVQAASYARGTGANPDFTTEGGAGGLGPNIYNWGVGLSVTFPVMDYTGLRARKEMEAHRERAEAARYEEVRRELTARREKAQAALSGTWRVARNTPILKEAAAATELQAATRYKAGLGTLVEVAEAQRLLTQAEIDDALARLHVWRAWLAVAAAQGDLEPLLREATR